MHARVSQRSRPEAPAAVVVHELHGRTRLRIQTRRNDTRYFSTLLKFLETIPEVTKALARPKTASLVLHHTDSFADLAARCEEEGLFVLVEPEATPDVSHAIVEGAADLDRRLREATSGALGLESGAGLTLAALGALQLLRGQVLPPAAALLLSAVELLRARALRSDDAAR